MISLLEDTVQWNALTSSSRSAFKGIVGLRNSLNYQFGLGLCNIQNIIISCFKSRIIWQILHLIISKVKHPLSWKNMISTVLFTLYPHPNESYVRGCAGLNNTFDLFKPYWIGNFAEGATIRSLSAFFQDIQWGNVWHDDIIFLWKYLLVVVEVKEWMNDRMNKQRNEHMNDQINEFINE